VESGNGVAIMRDPSGRLSALLLRAHPPPLQDITVAVTPDARMLAATSPDQESALFSFA
jgi:hypothetical protein